VPVPRRSRIVVDDNGDVLLVSAGSGREALGILRYSTVR